MRTHSIVTASLVAAAWSPMIVRRGDVPDGRYVEAGTAYPSVVSLGIGDATVIAPRWLLTAAHVAAGAQRRGVRSVRVGARTINIEGFVVHEAWRELGEHDIALVRLGTDAGVRSLRIYRGADERSRVATLVGHGAFGTGDSRARAEDGRRRAATSKVDSVTPAWLYFSFDAPPSGTALEGAPGPGDSGGPAILQEGGEPRVAGISSAGFDGRAGPATYGAVDAFTRVSTHARWVDSVMATPGSTSSAPRAAAANDTTIPRTAAGQRFGAFLAAARSGSDSAVAAFVRSNFDAREIESRPALIPNLQRIARQLRGAPIAAIVDSKDLTLTIRFTTESGSLTLELVCGAERPNLLVDWRRFG